MGNKTIAKIVEHAENRERERILKLLDEWLWQNAERLGTTYMTIWITAFMEQVEQLIKEGKE